MNTSKMLAQGVVWLAFAIVPFIAFLIFGGSTFFPYIVGKNFAFRIAVEIMFAGWVVLALIDPIYRPKKSYLLGALAAFVGIITLAAIFGENPAKSFWSNFERMEGVVTYFHLFAYFIAASTVLIVAGKWRSYLNLHLIAGVMMALYAVLQWAGDITIVQDGTRVNGTLGNAAYMGTYALFNIFLAGLFLVRESFTTTAERVRIGVYGFIVLLQTFVLYHTATRGAMLGLLTGAVVAAILVAIFERERVMLRKGAIGVLVALVVLVGGFIALRDAQFIKDSPVLSRFSSISLTETTTKSRFMIWDMAFQGFKEHPVLGWGMENFNFVFNKYYNPGMYAQEQWFDRAHNVFFDWLIAGGLPALLAYLSLFGVAVYGIWRRAVLLSVVERSVLTGLLAGYFFQNLFVFDNITSLILFFTVLAYIESLQSSVAIKKEKNAKAPFVLSAESVPLLAGAVIVCLIGVVYFVNYKGIMQNMTLVRAISEPSTVGPAHNLKLFKEAIAYESFGTSEAREQLAQVVLQLPQDMKQFAPAREEFVALAIEELKKQAALHATDARYQLFAGSFLGRIGRTDEALGYMGKAAELSPKKQTILFELGNAYYMKKDYAHALEIFRRAYEFAPEYPEAEKLYLQVLIGGKNYATAEQILKAHIARTPGDTEPHLNLAALYLGLGKRNEAVNEIRTAIMIKPEFKEQGEFYIEEIKAGRNP